MIFSAMLFLLSHHLEEVSNPEIQTCRPTSSTVQTNIDFSKNVSQGENVSFPVLINFFLSLIITKTRTKRRLVEKQDDHQIAKK